VKPTEEAKERKNGKSERVRRTAQRLLDGVLGIGADASAKRVRELAHELSVHQTELEMQNEELRRGQRALEVSHQKYVDLYDNAPVGYVTLDNRAVVEEANLTAATLLGVPARALCNAPFVTYVDPAFRRSFFGYFRKALASETGESCVASLQSRDGREVATRIDSRAMPPAGGQPGRVRLTLIDVTRQKKLEDEISFNERRLRLAIEQYPAAFVIFDLMGAIEFVNSHGAEFFGRNSEELIGMHIEELPPRVPDAYVRALKRAIETCTAQSIECGLESTGRFSDQAVTFTPVADGNHQVRQVLGVAYDVSAQKRRQGELEQAVLVRTSELVEANRVLEREVAERKSLAEQLKAHQRRLRGLSSELITTGERERQRLAAALHDRIGQALAFTKINIELLRNSVSDDEMVRQIGRVLLVLDQIITDTQTMIFDLSPPVLSLLGLGPAVEWLADRMQEEHGLAVVATHGDKPVRLADDVRILLFQAVKELLTNVVKHSGSATARVSIRRTKRTVRVLVEDAGVGMAQTEIESMNGFGLFSIHERLLDLGGSVKIDSRPGATRVLLVAPLALEGDTGSQGCADS